MGKMFSQLAALVLLVCCGCIWSGKSQQTCFFDLKADQKGSALLPCDVNFMLFRNLSGSDRRFLERRTANRVTADEFNRWQQDPELMLERFLREEIRGKGRDEVRIRGVITAFEFDAVKNEAVLAVDFTLYSGEISRRISCHAREKISDGAGPAAGRAAAAMNVCALRVASELRESIVQLLKQFGETPRKVRPQVRP